MDATLGEVQFEVVFTPDKALVREYISCVFRKGLKIFFYTLFSVMFLFSLIAILGGEVSVNSIAMIGMSVLGLLMPMLRINLDSKALLKQYKTLSSNGTSGIKVNFYDDNFNSNVYGRENTFKYNQISKVTCGKLGIYLTIEKSICVLIEKDAFTVSRYEFFMLFLREKLKDNPKALRSFKIRKGSIGIL